jgi:hypothetical protein
MMRAGMRRALLLATIALAAACSRGDADARSRLLAQRDERPVKTLDPNRPGEAIGLSADEVASRIGSFEWTGAIEWTVSRSGADAERVRVTEQHTLRQLATGEFEVGAELDPGLGPGSATGKQIVFAGGTTYARATPAPFRARPTDHGRDARRFREESFGLARDLLALCGPALRYEPGGTDHAVGREARRHRVTLAPGAAAPQAAPRPAADTRQTDPDTARRLTFLSGHVPQAAEGEVLLDAATGVPLRVRLSAAFTVRDQGDVRATVELLAQIKAIGAGVSSVAPPQGALPDERKPAGPSTALEAAGLKKRGEERPGADGPDDEQE